MPVPVVTLSPNGGTPLVITEPVYRFQEAPDWGVAETNVDLVEGTEIQGAVAGTRTQVVKQMVLSLMIDSDTGAAYIASAQALDLAATQLARDGGTVTHQVCFDDGSLSEALEAEVLSCSIDADAEWTHHRIGLVTLNLVAQPQWLAPEEQVAQVLNSTASLVELPIAALRGNLHGPGRVVIKDRSSQRRRFVELGAAFSQYDAAAEYEYRAAAFSLTGADGSLVTTAVTGRIGPNTISVLPLLPVWRTVGYLNALPLKGNFRVRVRSLCESEEVTVLQRVLWREGTNGAWRELETVEVPAGGFYDQDTGSIPNYSEAATIDIRVDVRSALGIESSAPYRLNVLTATPTDIYAVVRGFSVPVPAAGVGAYDASADVADATALDAARAPLIGGSNWAVAGSATKFTASGGIWQRTGVADASPGVGHHALLSPTAVTNTTVVLTANLAYTNAAKQTRAMIGALVRYVDVSNWAAAVIQVRRRNDGAYEPYLSFVKRVAGTLTYLKTKEAKKTNLAVNGLGYGAPGGFAISGAISVSVKADGSYEVSTGPNFSDLEATELALSGSDAVLATAGALASGKPGVYSSSEDADGVAQWYQIAAYADADASTLIDVVRSDGTGEVRFDKTYSADADGGDPQPVSSHQGRRRWLPPSTTGVITAKVRRDDSESEPDTYDAADAVDLTVYHRPAFATLSAKPAPGVITGAADGLDAEQATLNGTVNPRGEASTYYFEYGLTTGYGSEAPITLDGDAGDGTTAGAVDEVITGLTGGTTYHFRLVAESTAGITYGADATFMTVAAFDADAISGLVLWLDASELALSDGDAVTAWADRAAANNDVAQATEVNQPDFKESIINGLPVVRFPGAGNSQGYLSTAGNIDLTGGCTIFAVYEWDTERNYDALLQIKAAVGGSGDFQIQTNATGDLYIEANAGSHFAGWTDALPGAGVFAVHTFKVPDATPSNAVHRVDGAVDGRDSAFGSDLTPNAANKLHVGAGNSYLAGDLAELLVYNAVLSDGDRDDVEAYLADKYGL